MAFTREINWISLPFLLILPPLIFLLLKKLKSNKTHVINLPPGPFPWPILGNIPHMSIGVANKPHLKLTHYAKVYGPIISLKLGTRLMVVGSTPVAAAEILRTHDHLLSARYVPRSTPFQVSDTEQFALLWAVDFTEHWKSLKSLCTTELFSATAMASQSTLRQAKVAQMVDFLGQKEGKSVKISEIVFTTIFNTLGNILFSRDFMGFEQDDQKMKRVFRELMESIAAPNLSDLFPVLDGFDIQGLRKKAIKSMDGIFKVWEPIIKERREGDCVSKDKDFLDSMLALGFPDRQINILALELFLAGMDTTTTTIEWAMAELLKNRKALNQLKEELNNTHSLEESNISQRPYLKACVKETLRLHPPTPILLPHLAMQTCEIMNYTIPKNSHVFVNVYAIGRDPSLWEDPLVFKPERFMNSGLEFNGEDFELLAFGSGRRMCPGLPMATKQVEFMLANLIGSFDWFLPNGGNPLHLDMDEMFGTTVKKAQPLVLIPSKRS